MITVEELHEIKSIFIHIHVVNINQLPPSLEERAKAIRETAARMFGQMYPHEFHPDDMCIQYEHTEEDGVIVCRATWVPDFDTAELVGGPNDGLAIRLPFPNGTVTTASGVRTLHYHLTGFNTASRRHVFQLEKEGTHAQ